MRKKFDLVAFLVILFCGCNQLTKSSKNYIIKAPSNSFLSVVREIREEMNPIIDSIFKEELGISQDPNYPTFFFNRRHQAVSIYYLNAMNEDGKENLFSVLKNSKIHSPQYVSIASKLDFFGDSKKSNLIHLVVFVDDSKRELTHLNKQIKEVCFDENERYKKEQKLPLYDTREKFAYTPHFSLGHLRPQLIRKAVSGDVEFEDAISRIKKRIIDAVLQKISDVFSQRSRTIIFDNLIIYDLEKHSPIKIIDFDKPVTSTN